MKKKNLKQTASFGKLIMLFFTIMLALLSVFAFQTLEKLENEQIKQFNHRLEANLDKTIAETAQESFIFKRIENILNVVRKEDAKPSKLASVIKKIELDLKTRITCFLYLDNELLTSFDASEEENHLFKDLIKNLELKGPEFVKAQRTLKDQLMNTFGPGSRLEIIKGTKGRMNRFMKEGKDKYFFWDHLDNKKTVFIIIKSFPEFIERMKIYRQNSQDQSSGAGSPRQNVWLPPKDLSEDQLRASRIKANISGKTTINSFGYRWAFVEDEEGMFYCKVTNAQIPTTSFYQFTKWLFYLSFTLFILCLLSYTLSHFYLNPGCQICDWLDSISIRYRIMGLFAIASVFPVIFSLLIAVTSVAQRTEVISNQVLTESIANLRYLENMISEKIEQCRIMSIQIRNDLIKKEPSIEFFYDYLKRFDIPEYLTRLEVRDDSANVIFTLDDPEVHGLTKAIEMFSRIAIKLHSPSRVSKNLNRVSPGEIISEAVLSTDELGMASLLRQPGRTWKFRMGTFPTLWFWDVYPDLASGPAFMTFTTQLISIYRDQISKALTAENTDKENILAYAELNPYVSNFKVLPKLEYLDEESLLNSAITSMRTGKLVSRTVEIDSVPYWLTIKPEKTINSHVFLNLISKPDRLSALNPLKRQLATGSALALLVSLLGAMLLTRLFIWPIDDISKGINAIRDRNHDFRIQVKRNDEFGAISSAFNNVIEELKELEYGKVVQTSLLPSKIPVPAGYDLACFRASATDLAGDYHDVLALNDGKTAIILGDVTGHGISAALAMAMAKATVDFMELKGKYFPQPLMDKLNALFNKELKPRHKFMTLVTLVLDPVTNELQIDNAGQSFPYFYEATHDRTTEIAIPSMPLGAMKKRRSKPQTITMKKNDALILYSDGIIECSDSKGEMFGYDRFADSFLRLTRQKLSASEILETMISELDSFREPGPYPDDVTLVLIKKT